MKNSSLIRLVVLLSLAGSSALPQTRVPPAGSARYPGVAATAATARALPRSFQAARSAPPRSSLPPLDSSQLSEIAMQSGSGPRPPVVAVHRTIDAAVMGVGICETGHDGNQVWRLAVHSPQATGIRLHLQDFEVGAGTVWLYDAEAQSPLFLGPYTGRGPLNHGDFWTHTTFSQTVVVEYDPAPGESCPASIPFRLTELSHQFQNIVSGTSDPAVTCSLDVTCFPNWANAASSVARVVYEESGHGRICSGVLLNTRNSSFIPYFLTANHCISSEAVAQTVDAYWYYQTDTCNGTPPNMYSMPQTIGATYLVSQPIPEGDFSLLRLSENPPGGVWFAGWDTAAPAIGASLAGIHHPGNENDFKRITLGQRDADADSTIDGQLAPAALYYEFSETAGRTQQGSSGSPLYRFEDPTLYYVVGTLTYGPDAASNTFCAMKPFFGGYGRFSNAYPYISQYLEDAPGTTNTLILGAGWDGSLYRIVPATGATTRIGTLPAVMSDIAAHNGALYGITVAQQGLFSRLYSMDPNTGAGTVIGPNTGANLNALVFSPTGTLYAAGGNSLFTINTSTGRATLVGSGSSSGSYLSSGDLEFDDHGKLYLTSATSFGDQFLSVDPHSGQGTVIGNTGFSGVLGLVFLNGTMYGFTGGGAVVRIDLSSGVGNSIASYSPGFYGTAVFTATGGVAPEIASISPSSPIVNGSGQTLTVYGNNFQSGLTVTLYSPENISTTLSGSQIQSVGSSSFQMSATLDEAGTWSIRVNNPGGQRSNMFSFIVASPPPSPDLVVTAFTAPTSGFIGGQITITMTTANQGTADAGAFQVEFFLSRTASITNAVDTTWYCSVSGLAAGATKNCSGPIGIPSSLAPGTYYLLAKADDLNQVTESNKNNNVRAADTGTVAVFSVQGLQFIPVTPCRVADTRNLIGPFGGPTLAGGSARSFTIPKSACGIPSSAQAYSLNVTVVPRGPLSYLTLWPTGQAQPLVSTLNSFGGIVAANAAIVPAGTGGSVSVFVTDPTDVILDINGYFDSSSAAGAYSFYAATPCRVADTRSGPGVFGGPSMAGGQARAFPVPSSICRIPSAASAYSMNVTVVPRQPLGFLTTWPTGQVQPNVSTLNSWTGKIVANAALVPAGSSGAISVYVSNPTDLILDTNGYFAAPGNSGALSFYPVTPCRVADTRNATGPFGGPIMQASTTRWFTIPASACAIPDFAQAYSVNVTVVPAGPLPYLTAWPAGSPQPNVSTLNSFDGSIVANAAIVPAGSNGAVSVFVTSPTHVIIDINGYFAP